VCCAHHLLALGRSGTGFARAAGIRALVIQALRAKNSDIAFHRKSRVVEIRFFERPCHAEEEGLTKNANASFQVRVPASFTAHWLGYSVGASRGVQTAG
jgi:hypothetical protein